jgi:hypothetical protein
VPLAFDCSGSGSGRSLGQLALVSGLDAANNPTTEGSSTNTYNEGDELEKPSN